MPLCRMRPNCFCSFCSVPRASTLHMVPVQPLSAQLKSHAMSWLLGGIWTPWECQVHLKTSLSAHTFLVFSYSGFHRAQQGPSQVQLQVLPIFRETFHYRWLKVHVLFGLFHQSSVCYVGNTALSRIKQTFVASLPSDFWSLGHFGLAINKAQYQLSTIASLITGFKALI